MLFGLLLVLHLGHIELKFQLMFFVPQLLVLVVHLFYCHRLNQEMSYKISCFLAVLAPLVGQLSLHLSELCRQGVTQFLSQRLLSLPLLDYYFSLSNNSFQAWLNICLLFRIVLSFLDKIHINTIITVILKPLSHYQQQY